MDTWDALGGAAVGATGGIISQWMANRQTRRNNEQNEALMRESWARDDTAAQRSADDFEAAGLSRTLAAGNTAGNSGPIHLEAGTTRNIAADAMAGASAAVNIAQTKKQNDLIKAQIDKINAEKVTTDLQNQYLRDTLSARTVGTISEVQTAVDTSAAKVKQMDLETQKRQIGIEQAQLDQQASRKQIEKQELENAILRIEKSVKEKYSLSDAEAHLMALKLGNEITSYNAEWYKRLEYPISSSGSADIFTKGMGVLNILGGGSGKSDPEPMDQNWFQNLLKAIGINKDEPTSGRSH